MATYVQVSTKPTRKVLAGAIATIIAGACVQFLGFEPSEEALGAFTIGVEILLEAGVPGLIGLITAYFVKPKKDDQIKLA